MGFNIFWIFKCWINCSFKNVYRVVVWDKVVLFVCVLVFFWSGVDVGGFLYIYIFLYTFFLRESGVNMSKYFDF